MLARDPDGNLVELETVWDGGELLPPRPERADERVWIPTREKINGRPRKPYIPPVQSGGPNLGSEEEVDGEWVAADVNGDL